MATNTTNPFDKYFSILKKRIVKLENKLKANVIFFEGELNHISALALHKVIRKLNKRKLFLILESPGGQIDSAAKIVHMCKEYFDEFNVIVPSHAKSAATLICVAADNLFLGKCGEMGPVDPQVRHPAEKELFFPALAIKDAIEFIESSNDPFVKAGLTEKIDPYIMGAYKRVINLAKQYLESANLVKTSTKSAEIIQALTQKYISHGYPIDIKECKQMNIKLSEFKDKEIMNEVYDLFEEYVDDFIFGGLVEDTNLVIISSNIDVKRITLKKNQEVLKKIESLIEPKPKEEMK